MITIMTGLPGAGKTLYTLTWLKARAEKEKRPVFFSGIKDLKLPWTEHDPEQWAKLPANAIMVIDEAQRVFRPRMHGTKVPAFVEELETHRHLGIDIVLITQHPMLLDSNVRRLCGQHFHAIRKFGAQAATVHEWAQVKENCDKNRDGSTRHDFVYPKGNYGLYHSAEVHTHKLRIPTYVWIVLLMPILLAFLGWRLYASFSAKAKPEESAPAATLAAQGRASPPPQPGPLTQADYVNSFEPRVQGLAYTAPAYDGVTQPQQAPYPAACVQTAKECRCYSQQATRLDVPPYLCEGIVKGGFYMAWQRTDQGARTPQQAPAQAQAAVYPSAVGIDAQRPASTLPQPARYDGQVDQEPAKPRPSRQQGA